MHTKEQSQQAIRVNEIAKEIYRQIKATFNINVLWSWGSTSIKWGAFYVH